MGRGQAFNIGGNKEMKPIHHSNLKKGDLIYVESKDPNCFEEAFGKDYFLAEVDSLGFNLVLNVGQIGKFFESYVICDIKNCQDSFFLIERGYFL
jgi:hypothetical protein